VAVLTIGGVRGSEDVSGGTNGDRDEGLVVPALVVSFIVVDRYSELCGLMKVRVD